MYAEVYLSSSLHLHSLYKFVPSVDQHFFFLYDQIIEASPSGLFQYIPNLIDICMPRSTSPQAFIYIRFINSAVNLSTFFFSAWPNHRSIQNYYKTKSSFIPQSSLTILFWILSSRLMPHTLRKSLSILSLISLWNQYPY